MTSLNSDPCSYCGHALDAHMATTSGITNWCAECPPGTRRQHTFSVEPSVAESDGTRPRRLSSRARWTVVLVGVPAAIWLAANVLYGWQVGQFPAVIDVLTIYGPPAVVVVLLLASAVDWASTGREPWDGNLETWTPLR